MRRTLVLACAAAAIVLACPLQAQKTTKKPVKPVTSQATKGTAQLAGDNAKMGVTYTIGKARDAINFTLLSAEYWPTRILLKDDLYVPNEDEKFLVLHFTLHNPNPAEYTVNWATLKFTAIDSHDVNHQFTGNGSVLFMKEGTNEQTQVALKPAQKIAVQTAIRIPSDASVPKLMVQQGESVPVLRLYFKPGEIKRVAAPFADPADQTGCVALKEVTVGTGVYVPAQDFDVKFVSGAYAAKVGDHEPREGEQVFLATLTVRNATLAKVHLFHNSFQTNVKTEDGDKTDANTHDMYKAQRDAAFESELDPGEEATVRVLIDIPANVKVKQFRLMEGERTRPIIFNVN